MRPDTAFKNYVVSHLAGLPGVRAVTLGGSRAAGKHGPDSDWDFAVYYRGAFSPGDLRAVGWRDAQATLGYGRAAYAARGRLTETAGTLGVAACQAGHAVLAASGQWVTNEKTLLDRAGLCGLDQILAGLTPDPDTLTGAVDAAESCLRAAVTRTDADPAPG